MRCRRRPARRCDTIHAPRPAAPPGSLADLVAGRAAARRSSAHFVPDEVLVTVDGDAAVAADIAAAFGLEVRSQRSLDAARRHRRALRHSRRPPGRRRAGAACRRRPHTRRVPNHIYDLQQAAGIVNYAFQRIALEPDSASGENVKIAVIDTAIDETHPALEGRRSPASSTPCPASRSTARDHGTSVAGLIAGTGEFRGMAPGSKIYHARAFEGGKSTMDVILSALDWAAEQDVRIINMSFVGPKNELLEEACAHARDARHRAGRRGRQQRPEGALRLSGRLSTASSPSPPPTRRTS